MDTSQKSNIIRSKYNALLFYFDKWSDHLKNNYRNSLIKFLSYSYFNTNEKNVVIGSAFSKLGGVPHHIQSIKKGSIYKPLIIPDPGILDKISKWGKLDFYRLLLAKQLEKNKPKIIHTHVDPWFMDLAKNFHINGSAWIHTYHTLYFEKDWDNGLAPWQEEVNYYLTTVAKDADVKIAISIWLGEYLKTTYNIETVYIPNGVEVKKCDLADKVRFIKAYGMQDFILFASGISDIKNVGDFLKLANALPQLPFVIIGRGISVEALSKKHTIPIGNNLKIIGQMPHEELLDAIDACKVFVVTSRSEGLPTVLMEAMALRKTVVGCDLFGTKEVISDETNGYIYNHSSLQDLIDKTEMAFDKGDKGEKARQRILENYDWQVVIPQIDSLYSKYS